MRYSEAVKRHKLETKQRILNSVLEAAERENNKPSAIFGNYDTAYNTDRNRNNTDRETEKKETITMRNTQINEVRSRKGGIIAAAACAALVIGGGISLFANSSEIGLKTTPAASSASEAGSSSKEAEAVLSGETSSNEAATAVDSETSDEKKPTETTVVENSVPDQTTAEDTSLPETVIPETNTNKVVGKNSFNELLASSNTIYLGTVSDANAQTLEMPDGTVKNVIKYTLGGHFYAYDISTNRIRERHGAETFVLQEVNAGTEPQIKPGETALFMTGEASLADINGGFVYDSTSHQLFNATYSHDDIALGMRDYMLNVILAQKDLITVDNWIGTLGESYDSTETDREDLATNTVNSVYWNSDLDRFAVSVNYNPKSARIREIKEKGQFTNILGSKNSQKISGFDDVDLNISSIGYTSDMTAVIIQVNATPKNGFEFDPSAVYELSYDRENSGIVGISWAVNADVSSISEGLYYPIENTLTFDIMFDQAGTDGLMEFDPETEFSFTINGINALNGDSVSGEYKFTYTYDRAAVESVGNAKIVTRDTATNKY